jgi:hypothetical protein
MSAIEIANEQQIVEEIVPKAKGKASKKQNQASTGGSTSTQNDEQDTVSSLKTLVEELTKRVQELETRLSEVEKRETENKTSTEPPTKQKGGKGNEEKKPRAPTAYNLFMKEKMTELKDTHPSLTNIERMKMAAEAWSESKK